MGTRGDFDLEFLVVDVLSRKPSYYGSKLGSNHEMGDLGIGLSILSGVAI